MTPDEVAEIITEHSPVEDKQWGKCCDACSGYPFWPCLPYRLAEALAASEAKVAPLCLEPSPFLDDAVCVRAAGHEDEHVSSAHVEDRAATEGFSYVVTALADQPEQAANFRRSADA